jgi:hypothetical protein
MRGISHLLLLSALFCLSASIAPAQEVSPLTLNTRPAFPGFAPRVDLDNASRKELENLRRVAEEDRSRYAPFLKGENTGIFKLFPDNGCTAKNLIRVDGDCEGFVPDSSVYTFRTETYGRRVGDLALLKDNFAGRLVFSQPIFVPLGDVPIEVVTEIHPAARLLTELQPNLAPATAERASMVLAQGFGASDYTFTATSSTSAGPTYLFRQIAFNVSGKVPKQRFRTRFGVVEVDMFKRTLQYQERKDTVYAFRVVRKDDDGVLTIVWKQLSRKDAPAIVFEKGDKIPNLIWEVRPQAK